MVDISDIRLALRKLLSFTYYDKSDLILRRNVADFVKAINNPEKEEDVLNSICDVANGKDEEGGYNGYLAVTGVDYEIFIIQSLSL